MRRPAPSRATAPQPSRHTAGARRIRQDRRLIRLGAEPVRARCPQCRGQHHFADVDTTRVCANALPRCAWCQAPIPPAAEGVCLHCGIPAPVV